MSKALEYQVSSGIRHAMQELEKVQEALLRGNEEGKQFDYVTHPNASNEVDALVQKVERIKNIMYP